MASSENLRIEKIKSIRQKEKVSINGFIYSLHTSGDTLQWRCEKRGTCNARLHTDHDIVVKPDNPEAMLTSHTHGPDLARIEMLKGYSEIKRPGKRL